MTAIKSVVADAKRIVIKVGTALLTDNGRGLDEKAIANLAEELSAVQKLGREVVLVSSGSIAEGVRRLGWERRPTEVGQLQAAAAVGQMGLAQAYETEFAKRGVKTAQILLTGADLADRTRYLNARSALLTLLSLGVVPVINENDTVVTDEIKVGDNDTLGSVVTNLIEADALVILTDQKGLFTADPRKNPDAVFVDRARAGDPALEKMAGGAASSFSKGGMITKVIAAKRAAQSGASTVIVYGREPRVLQRLAAGETIGTELVCYQPRILARKSWIADHLNIEGAVLLDAGAARAIVKGNTSLLPVGVKEVRGDFKRGDVIAVLSPEGDELARGLAGYSSSDTVRIAGHHTEEIEGILGFIEQPELIHKDNLVITRD
ncbi:glutamate 5-kinase [Mesosutterella multiformis]|jgi:glutamate 5-kinase|uniref:Glutamate 5-kinase n=1 Tax=Mesosutterella multiformis TaxID=2259133 RepID=A0A388S9W4_9BURK|nr:glutamate 5-kinase [Mesosutterella multiformis]MBS5811244.1 glutamate 5-kinase [Sutterella sp.]MCH3935534.1 glutamate 5-kinase [Mesosutterella sp.]RGU78961.1 glutamate 5-kinase [Sutterella sp. AF15-45LB]RGU80157.1 glutamate 5-kinase [Sutterella sp. AF15-44LB]RHH08363.1 glutamate 5-kinase [Sutterella sp. AM18-8-1]